MVFPVLATSLSDAEAFLEFWDRLYSGYDEGFYRTNIGQPLTPQRIERWFEWKNGSVLSARKAQTILRYSEPEQQVHADASTGKIVDFLSRDGGAIWRIFWLHLQHPARYPIYDQHVHRAMAFMKRGESLEIPSYNPAKVRTYLGSYVPFFESFLPTDRRRLDRALWSFGKFLATPYGKALHLPILTGTSVDVIRGHAE